MVRSLLLQSFLLLCFPIFFSGNQKYIFLPSLGKTSFSETWLAFDSNWKLKVMQLEHNQSWCCWCSWHCRSSVSSTTMLTRKRKHPHNVVSSCFRDCKLLINFHETKCRGNEEFYGILEIKKIIYMNVAVVDWQKVEHCCRDSIYNLDVYFHHLLFIYLKFYDLFLRD